MSDTSSDPGYASWQDAALGGNLLSYAWQHRPEMKDLVPGYSPDEAWWQKGLDVLSVPARLASQPVLAGGDAFSRWMSGDQGPETRNELTSSVMGLGARGLALETPGPASFGAWHGSRHLFEPESDAPLGKFRNEAVGTGEGHQAYGWGHYVAGSKGVAESYKDAGGGFDSGLGTFTIDGKYAHPSEFLDSEPFKWQALHALDSNNGNFQDAIQDMQDHAVYLKRQAGMADPAATGYDAKGHYLTVAKQQIDGANWLEENAHRITYTPPPEGHLYSVHVEPEEHHLLDWDQPVHEQPDIVDKLNKAGLNVGAPGSDNTGHIAYRHLSRMLGSDKAASETLNDAGIPGLKYRDQGSRNLPDDHPDVTRNYVLFHPSHMRIIGRDGEHHGLEPVDHDPFNQ